MSGLTRMRRDFAFMRDNFFSRRRDISDVISGPARLDPDGAQISRRDACSYHVLTTSLDPIRAALPGL